MVEGGELGHIATIATGATPQRVIEEKGRFDGQHFVFRTYPAAGIELTIEQEVLSDKRRRAVDKVMLGAVAHPDKRRSLGESLVMDVRLAVSAGQDVAGARLATNDNLQVVAVAADGCSFGGLKDSREAARVASMSILNKAAALSDTYSRAQVTDYLADSIVKAHERVKKEAPNGATTVAVSAIGVDRSGGGPEVYLHALGVGDAQITVVYTDKEGKPVVKRIISPADQLDKMLREQGINLADIASQISIAALWKRRDQEIAEFAKRLSWDIEEARRFLTGSGIWDYLGHRPEAEKRTGEAYLREAIRVNLTRDLFDEEATNVVVLTSTDYVGDKMHEDEIAGAYTQAFIQQGTGIDGLMAQLRGTMVRGGLDDGSVIGYEVTQPLE